MSTAASPRHELVSHALCPYVQRAAITLAEKRMEFTRTVIDLADKPDWFRAISPLGKVPLLRVGDAVLFESAVICDYLDETVEPRLHPADALERARHRGWIEFASALLNDIGRLYAAPEEAAFEARKTDIRSRLQQLEAVLVDGPYFAGRAFSVVDAAFAPAFRYFEVFETFVDLGTFEDLPRLRAWRDALRVRPSVRDAVAPDYPQALRRFLAARDSHMAGLAKAMPDAA